MKCWVFMDPKDGRKIRTVHASFFERRRDPHEHVDIADMMLTTPTRVVVNGSDTQPDGWQCQLWPTHRWPGRDFADMPKSEKDISDEWDAADYNDVPKYVNEADYSPDAVPGNFHAPLDVEFD